jgi:RNA polymerase sigma-70 factor (ECF subfamily)
MEDDDAALLRGVREGSERAFNRLVDRHQQAVRTFLRKLAGPDAEDVAQDVFIALWRRAHSFRGDASVRSWLFAIAWRKAKDSQRRWFRQARRETAWRDTTAVEAHPPAEETRVALAKALAALPLDQRAAVVLCLAHGFTHVEAAEILRLPLGTVKSHVSRGRDKLGALLGDG